MSNENGEAKLLRGVEKRLAKEQPFGDYRYIDERNWLQYEARLEMLAEYVPEAGRTLAGLRQANGASRYRVLGDPVVRSVINTGLAHYKLDGPEVPLAELQAVLGIAARHLAENSRVAPLAVGAGKAKRLGRASYHGWIWCDEREEDIPAQSFRRLFHRQEGARSALWTPDEQGQRMLEAGTKLLSELLPELARSALNHLHLVAIVENPSGFASVTTPSILGTVFFSPLVLKHPWRTAEYLLHEAIHLKFIDLENTHSLLRDGYDSESSPKIEAVWNRSNADNPNEWPVNRVLTVAHTYICLALFFKMLKLRSSELADRYGPLHDLDPGLSARRALDRAQYLIYKVKEVGGELGVAGHRFVDWLSGITTALDPCPKASGSSAHLFLDLYDRETETIKTLIAEAKLGELIESPAKSKQVSPEFSTTCNQRLIIDLVQREMASTDQLLLQLEGSSLPFHSERGELALGKMISGAPENMADRFCTIRSLISQSLSKVAAKTEGKTTGLIKGIDVNEYVRSMVEASGEDVRILTERLGS
jgi:hypothetical protein